MKYSIRYHRSGSLNINNINSVRKAQWLEMYNVVHLAEFMETSNDKLLLLM